MRSVFARAPGWLPVLRSDIVQMNANYFLIMTERWLVLNAFMRLDVQAIQSVKST